MKKPKIGLKTYETGYKGKDKIEFEALEIIPKDPLVNLSAKTIHRIKGRTGKAELSFHSQIARALTSKKQIERKLEDQTMRAELTFCKALGIKEFIFHLKKEPLTKDDERIVSGWIKYAKKLGVQMIFESNNGFFGRRTLDVLKRFSWLKYNLDLGHLNLAIAWKRLGMPLDEFLAKVRDRIVYVHAHNNSGDKRPDLKHRYRADEHKPLDEGTLDWEYVMDQLDMNKVKKIMIEVKGGPKAIKKTKKLLENYLKKRK